jgi:hypothetical protein
VYKIQRNFMDCVLVLVRYFRTTYIKSYRKAPFFDTDPPNPLLKITATGIDKLYKNN